MSQRKMKCVLQSFTASASHRGCALVTSWNLFDGRKLMKPRRFETALGLVAVVMALLGHTIPAAAQSAAAPTGKPVSFAPDQSDRGKSRYDKDCRECHGKDLKGGMNGGAPIRGLAFEEKYFEGLPASVMFSFLSSAMPPESPGRYSETIYADLMAYILDMNGVKEGAPLPSDFDALDNLIMNK